MASSRTIKTLTALLAAMTAGVFTLMLMETEPYQPDTSLTAVGVRNPVAAIISDTEAVVRAARWRNIVIHTTGAEGNDVVNECHFILAPAGDGSSEMLLQATDLWRAQQVARQTRGLGEAFDAESIIGVCIVGDFSVNRPTDEQFDKLVTLVTSLQKHFDIGAARVYLLGHIDPLSQSPGPAFPARAFEQRLIK